MADICEHSKLAKKVQPSGPGCEEGMKTGEKWVALRECLVCGHVGCCDSSPGRHATEHYKKTGHPIMKEFPRGGWAWCYKDEKYIEVPKTP